MKTFLKITKLLAAALLILGFSCSNDDDNATLAPTTVVDVVVSNNLTTFSEALEETDLISTLQGSGPFTVFAPSNAALEEFLMDLNIDLSNMTATEISTVRNLLKNHIIAESNISSTDLINAGSGYVDTQADGVGGFNISLFYNVINNNVMLNGVSSVTEPDKTASNGVVHIVNDVLFLPTIVTFVTADPNFNSLEAALTANGQPDFISTLSLPNGLTPPPFTVFAPVNSAFQDLLDSNTEWNSLADIDSSLLTSVLEHHIIEEANVRSEDLTDGMSPTTSEGDMITINLPGNNGNPAKITDGSGNMDIDIIAVDVQATNGVVHAIESVLIPNTTN
ncbi:fasciclin domain-containing protein [Winogradskyella forsetii]|uniref:fasciclin domain-containing protein n=1 Tax=Winogradskyella forsetii TaxID=2686077 RepID=UPI0015BDD952|nr:fasciclin domain-containing protein [Winogradskyella forsetii]